MCVSTLSSSYNVIFCCNVPCWRLRISDFVNSTSQSLYIGLSYVYKFWVESKRHVRLTWESLGKIPEKRIL